MKLVKLYKEKNVTNGEWLRYTSIEAAITFGCATEDLEIVYAIHDAIDGNDEYYVLSGDFWAPCSIISYGDNNE